MTLTQLSYVVAVDNYRHFATAAEKSYVTQPTLSMQIQKLEDELGIIIFDRSKQPVIPTDVGIKIIEQARVILKEAEEIKSIIKENQDEFEGTYRIGVIPTVASYLIPLFLEDFTSKYPKLQLIFEEMMTRDVIAALNEDRLDVGIIATPPSSSNFRELPLYHEPFKIYTGDQSSLSSLDFLSADDIEYDTLWLLNEGHCLRDQTLELCKRSKQQKYKSVSFESGNLETLIKLVDKGMGTTLLPYLATTYLPEQNKHRLKTFKNPQPGRDVRLIYGRLFTKSKVMHALREQILESLPSMIDQH